MLQVSGGALRVTAEQADAGSVQVGRGVVRIGVGRAEQQVAVCLRVVGMVGACHGVELVGVQFARRFFGEAACFFRGALAADVLDAECVLSQAGVDGA